MYSEHPTLYGFQAFKILSEMKIYINFKPKSHNTNIIMLHIIILHYSIIKYNRTYWLNLIVELPRSPVGGLPLHINIVQPQFVGWFIHLFTNCCQVWCSIVWSWHQSDLEHLFYGWLLANIEFLPNTTSCSCHQVMALMWCQFVITLIL